MQISPPRHVRVGRTAEHTAPAGAGDDRPRPGRGGE